MTLSRAHSDLNNIVADEGFDDAYTDDSDDCCALGTKQPSIPRNMRRHTVKFEVLANALATCKNCTNSPHDFHKTIRSCCHFKGKLHVFNSYDGSFNAGLWCNIHYVIQIFNCSFYFLSIDKVEVTYHAVRIKKSYYINQCPLWSIVIQNWTHIHRLILHNNIRKHHWTNCHSKKNSKLNTYTSTQNYMNLQ